MMHMTRSAAGVSDAVDVVVKLQEVACHWHRDTGAETAVLDEHDDRDLRVISRGVTHEPGVFEPLAAAVLSGPGLAGDADVEAGRAAQVTVGAVIGDHPDHAFADDAPVPARDRKSTRLNSSHV